MRLHLSLPLAVLRIAASAEIRLMRFCGWGGNLLRRQDAALRLARDIELVNAACHLRLAAWAGLREEWQDTSSQRGGAPLVFCYEGVPCAKHAELRAIRAGSAAEVMLRGGWSCLAARDQMEVISASA